MILLVDHQDSFTRNLEHLLAGFDEVVVRDRKSRLHLTGGRGHDCNIPGPGCRTTILRLKSFTRLGEEKFLLLESV